ncbi:hypothetical protein [Rhodanobacter lindaniclasticus]
MTVCSDAASFSLASFNCVALGPTSCALVQRLVEAADELAELVDTEQRRDELPLIRRGPRGNPRKIVQTVLLDEAEAVQALVYR